tara:strand:- start:1205 stop:1534 length:330 start_codon:yes stop_codon:yes gene_type:complete
MEHKVIIQFLMLVEHQFQQLEVDSVPVTTDLGVRVDLVVVEHTQVVLLPQIKDLVQQTRDMMVDMVMISVTQVWVAAVVALVLLVETLLDPDLLDLEEMVRHQRSLDRQ